MDYLPKPKGSTEIYRFIARDENGDPATGLTIPVKVLRRSDNYVLNNAGTPAFVNSTYPTTTPPNATEITALAAGVYSISIPTSAGVAETFDVAIEVPGNNYPAAIFEVLNYTAENLTSGDINSACDLAFTDYDPPTKAELDSGLAGLNDLSAAQVNAEVDTALADYDPPTKAELDSAIAGIPAAPAAAAVADAVWDEDLTGHQTVGMAGRALEDSRSNISSVLTQVSDIFSWTENANDPSASVIADAVWDEAKADHTNAAAFGGLVQATNVDTTSIIALLMALNDLSAAEVAAELATYDAPTKAELDAGLAALNDPTAASIADAVWDEARAGHTTAGTFGETSEWAGGGGGSCPTLEEIVDGVLDEDMNTHSVSGSLAFKVKQNDNNIQILQNQVGALNDLSAAQVNAEVDTALADYDPPTKAEMDAGFAAIDIPTVGEIADQVWDEQSGDHVAVGSTGLALRTTVTVTVAPYTTVVSDMERILVDVKVVEDSFGITVQWSVTDENGAEVNLETFDKVRLVLYEQPGKIIGAFNTDDVAPVLTVSGNQATLVTTEAMTAGSGTWTYDLWGISSSKDERLATGHWSKVISEKGE